MADFSDIVDFTRTHRPCGDLRPLVRAESSGGYLLTLTCGCRATLARRLTAEEAAHGPFATGRPAAEPPRRSERPRPTPSPELERAMRDALEAEDTAMAAPPARERRAARVTPSPDLEAVLHEAMAAEAAPAPSRTARKRAAPSAELENPLRQAVAASDTEAKLWTPTPRPTSTVQKTGRAALREHERRRTRLPPDQPKSRRRGFGLVTFAVLAVIAGVGAAVYVAETPEGETRATLPGPASPQAPAGSYGHAVIALRRVQTASVPTISLPAYEAQVGAAQAIIGRYLEGDAPQDVKRNVRAILDLHLLAVAAWRLRSVDTLPAWEPLSRSPVLDLCVPAKNAADSADRRGEPNARARGRAVALAIPLLWECTSARLAQLDVAR